MRDWKGNIKKASLAGVIGIGVLASGTIYYTIGNFVTNQVKTVSNAIVANQQAEQAQLARLEAMVQMGIKAEQQQINAMVKIGNMLQHESNTTVHFNYTVTGDWSEDGYVQTVNGAGEEVWLSNIETDRLELNEGDQVQIVTNNFGEVVTLQKIK